MKGEQGISIIICCYNSAGRLVPTLEHLSQQFIPENTACELIIVNNNSSDNTVELATELWIKLNTPFPLRIIDEPNPGTGHARRAGMRNATYEYLLFVDDDNWLEPNYVANVINILVTKPKVAACGGSSTLPEDGKNYTLPDWWPDFKHAYVVGPQGKAEGYVRQLATAGLGLRKSVFDELAERDYQLVLSGRKGNEVLAAGEDYEICAAFRYLGYKIFYTPKLKFVHALDNSRMTDAYLFKMYRGNGISAPYISAYYFTEKYGKHSWTKQMLVSTFLACYFAVRMVISTGLNHKMKAFKFRVKLQNSLGRIEHLSNVAPADYNTVCEKMYTLKKTGER